MSEKSPKRRMINPGAGNGDGAAGVKGYRYLPGSYFGAARASLASVFALTISAYKAMDASLLQVETK